MTRVSVARTSRPALDPRLPIVIRPSGRIQIGWDPDTALILTPPESVEPSALVAVLHLLDGRTSRPNVVWRAVEHGITPTDMSMLLAELDDAGLLRASVPARTRPRPSASTGAARSRTRSPPAWGRAGPGCPDPPTSPPTPTSRGGTARVWSSPTISSPTRAWWRRSSTPASRTCRCGCATAGAWWGLWSCRAAPAACGAPTSPAAPPTRNGRTWRRNCWAGSGTRARQCTKCLVIGPAGVRCKECARNKVSKRWRGVAHDLGSGISNVDGRKVWYLYIFAMIARMFGGWFEDLWRMFLPIGVMSNELHISSVFDPCGDQCRSRGEPLTTPAHRTDQPSNYCIHLEGGCVKSLELQRDGLTGQFGEISKWLTKADNAWLNPSGQGQFGGGSSASASGFSSKTGATF